MDPDIAAASRVLNDHPDFRVLTRLQVEEGLTGQGDPVASFVAAVVDVETTGLDYETDRIIELAVRRFRYDSQGLITKIDRAFTWMEDPGVPLDPEIGRLTGITDSDLAGRSIDDASAVAVLGSVNVVLAHNAAFDRKFVDRRLPEVRGAAWACTCREIDWQARGFDGRGLGWLLAQAGHFHEGHRATDDVDAVIRLLHQGLEDGRPAMGELLDNSTQPAWTVHATGAHFDTKHLLKARGYRWDPDRRVWFTEILDRVRTAEDFWLAAHIYTASARPSAGGPSYEAVDWHSRYA